MAPTRSVTRQSYLSMTRRTQSQNKVKINRNTIKSRDVKPKSAKLEGKCVFGTVCGQR